MSGSPVALPRERPAPFGAPALDLMHLNRRRLPMRKNTVALVLGLGFLAAGWLAIAPAIAGDSDVTRIHLI